MKLGQVKEILTTEKMKNILGVVDNKVELDVIGSVEAMGIYLYPSSSNANPDCDVFSVTIIMDYISADKKQIGCTTVNLNKKQLNDLLV